MAVAESGSMAEGARRLNLAPTTLAMRIRTIEEELGFALVRRSGRTIRLTPAGKALALRAPVILRELQTFRLLHDEEGLQGQLRLGVAQSAIATVLCDLLPALARRYPKLEIVVQKGSSAQVFDRLNASAIDAAFLFHPPFRLPKGLAWRSLRTEDYVVIANAVDPDADPLRLLQEQPLVRYDRSLWSGQIAENYLRQQRIRPIERIELDALDAITVLVERGIGVSLVPNRMLPWPGGLALAKLALPEPAPKRQLGLAWPVTSNHVQMIRAVERETNIIFRR